MKFQMINLRWDKDEDGWYWTADMIDESGKIRGTVGNYYQLDERLAKIPKEAFINECPICKYDRMLCNCHS